MGVVNVTPDSFSDGGDHAAPDAAITHGQQLFAEGADILDIGGESTRPGATPVSAKEELARVIPVIEGLSGAGVPISIDTRNAVVMQTALKAGAAIVNDVSALQHDPKSLNVVAEAGCPVVLMHAQGDPQTMQDAPRYDDVVTEVRVFFEARLASCAEAGITQDRIILDPGIGFGKTLEHNLELLKNLRQFNDLGCPILLGVSRKRFIDAIAEVPSPKDRLPGSLAAGLAGLAQGVHILRVHDVAPTVQALKVWQAIQQADA